jgi:hypothetical protein
VAPAHHDGVVARLAHVPGVPRTRAARYATRRDPVNESR